MPLVSVVLPVRDGESFLEEALESVREQTFSDWELVVIDDGSTDGTPGLLRSWAQRDARIRIHRQEGRGIGAALRLGCSLSSAPLIARMDADDVCRPERLQRQVELLERRPEVSLVGTGVRYVDSRGRPIKVALPPADDAGIRQRLEVETVFFHPTVVVRRAAYEAVSGYREVAVPAEDLDLWLRLAEQHRMANIPEPLLDYRLHAGQQLVAGVARSARAVLAVRASAAYRRRGDDDPLDDMTTVDEDAMSRLGISPRQQAREEVTALVYAARKLDQAGDHETAEELRARALRMVADPGADISLDDVPALRPRKGLAARGALRRMRSVLRVRRPVSGR